MTKTLKSVKYNDKTALKRMKYVQDCIPLEAFAENGVFLVQENKNSKKFSATYQIKDISYLKLSEDMQRQIFFAWSAVINSLEPGSTAKLNVIKHKINSASLGKFLMNNDNPQYAEIQREYNKLLWQKASQGNGMIQEIYITISVNKKNKEAADSFFLRTDAQLKTLMLKLGSFSTRLDGKERLELLRNIYRSGIEDGDEFNLEQALKTGSTAKNYIAPESMEFSTDHFKLGSLYGRSIVLHSYPAFLKDSIVSDLCEINNPMIFSMDIIPVPMDEAVREAEKRATNIEANISKWFQKQYNNKNFAAEPPYDMKQQREQAQEYLTDLTERDQHLMYCVVTMTHLADTKEQLDEDTDSIMTAARTRQCRLNILRWQQLDGLNTSLPIGVRRVEDIMTLTTEGVAGFMPFKSTEVQEENGFCFGQNQISKNLITINPKKQQSANSVYLGRPGSGKSMSAKWLILCKVLASAGQQHEIVIIDPEREYSPLVKALGGEVVYLSADSNTHINALDVQSGYQKDDNPITAKADFMLSLCEQLMYPTILGPKEKSIIDRCTEMVLRDYVKNNCEGKAPTLVDFYHLLMQQPEPEARDIALSIELYVSGSLSTFAKETNININNHIICFDIYELNENLMSVGMLVLFDHIQNRMIHNRAKGITTSIVNDEFYLMLAKSYSAGFFYKMWKRGRKYDCNYSGLTQNVEDLMRTAEGRAILNTSEMIVMLNQSPYDCEQLSDMLSISENMQEYITNAKAGSGLIKFGDIFIPFENDIPKNSKIYELLNTTPGEAVYLGK